MLGQTDNVIVRGTDGRVDKASDWSSKGTQVDPGSNSMCSCHNLRRDGAVAMVIELTLD